MDDNCEKESFKEEEGDDVSMLKAVELLKLKVKLDNGEDGYVFTKCTESTAKKVIFRCHVCNVPIQSCRCLEEHSVGKNHTKRMLANFHPHENFTKIVIKESPKLSTDVGGKVIKAPGVDIPDLAPGEPVPPGFEDIVTRVPEIISNLEEMKAPLIGLEYLAEITPVEDQSEPKYCCLLCNKRGDPRTVFSHLVCFNHRIKYIGRYFPRTHTALALIPRVKEYKRGTGEVLSKIVKAIESKFGRLNPVIVDGAVFDAKKEEIYREMRAGRHFYETAESNYDLLVDFDFIKNCSPDADTVLTIDLEKEEAKKKSTAMKNQMNKIKHKTPSQKDENSAKTAFDKRNIRNANANSDTRKSVETVSSSRSRSYSRSRSSSRSYSRSPVSETESFSKSYSKSRQVYRYPYRNDGTQSGSKSLPYYRRSRSRSRSQSQSESRSRYRSRYSSRSRSRSHSRSRGYGYRRSYSSRYTPKSPAYGRSSYKTARYDSSHKDDYEYPSSERPKSTQLKVAELRDKRKKREQYAEYCKKLEKDMAKVLQNYKKNPEKHPLYPEEWKKFWSRRYKELTAEGLDPTKHDFKPEWIKFWLQRIKELHNEELEKKKEKFKMELGLTNEKTFEFEADVIEVSPTPFEDDKNRSKVTVDDIKNTWKALTGTEIKSSKDKPPEKSKSPQKEEPVRVIKVLRLLTALESQLGSLGPRVNNLLSQAIALEKKKSNSSDALLEVSENHVLFETVKEKLKGLLFAGIIEKHLVNATRKAIQNVAELFNSWRIQRNNPPPSATVIPVDSASCEPLIVPGIGAIDKVFIAQQIAAALVAQGKYDITEQDLEQLINAVVGMAQATEPNPTVSVTSATQPATTPPVIAVTPTGDVNPKPSILDQLVSSANWKSESLKLSPSLEDAPKPKIKRSLLSKDVADLSEEDMKNLLQNFKDLMPEEQQCLIAHLKDLESKDPDSVEKLRKFVNSAESTGKSETKDTQNDRLSPFSMREGGANPFIDDRSKVQTEDADDDDDYSYEEIYKAAEKKVCGKSVVEQMIKEQEKKAKQVRCESPEKKLSEDPERVLNEAKVMLDNLMEQLPSKYNVSGARNPKTTPTINPPVSEPPPATYAPQPMYETKPPNNLLNDYYYQDEIFGYSNEFQNYSENYQMNMTNDAYNQVQQQCNGYPNSEQGYNNYNAWRGNYSQFPPPPIQRGFNCPPNNPLLMNANYTSTVAYQSSSPNEYNGSVYSTYQEYY